jgi:glycogen debranching enzyme
MGALGMVFTGIFQAATQFTHERLPEVFDGFSRDDYQLPVHYPVARSPQAWAAGALPLPLRAALGLEPDALAQRLMIHRPHLPDWLNRITVQGLHVGAATIDLQFQRSDATTLVAVQRKDGPCAIDIEN